VLQSLPMIVTYPGHAPEVLPVDGHGCDRWKSRLAVALRLILPRLSRAQEEHFAEDRLESGWSSAESWLARLSRQPKGSTGGH
jgi:hypothetical protein